MSPAMREVIARAALAWRPQGTTAHRVAEPSIDALREALPDGLRVAADLASEAAANPSAANLDALLAQLHGLQSIALRLRCIVGTGGR
ncbi:MAG: hypothetical protein ACK59M_11105 [Pseudomonadota bacterium]